MLGIVLTAAALTAAPMGGDARELFARRQALLDVDARCNVLEARERAALSSAALQARGALVRAGIDPAPVARRAGGRAATLDCDDPRIAEEAGIARAAFAGWSAQQSQDFPGEAQAWRAVRPNGAGAARWTLYQDLGDSHRLGVIGDGPAHAFVLALPAAAGAPRTVALDYRDPGKWRDFVDPTLGGLFQAGGADALARRAAPPALSKRVWSGGAAEMAVASPDTADGGTLFWTMPDEALRELAGLDPRDVARLTVERRDGSQRVLFVEIGDLAAAMAFLEAGTAP